MRIDTEVLNLVTFDASDDIFGEDTFVVGALRVELGATVGREVEDTARREVAIKSTVDVDCGPFGV